MCIVLVCLYIYYQSVDTIYNLFIHYYYNNKLQINLYTNTMLKKYRTLRNTNIYIIRKIMRDLLNPAFTYGTIII